MEGQEELARRDGREQEGSQKSCIQGCLWGNKIKVVEKDQCYFGSSKKYKRTREGAPPVSMVRNKENLA